MTLQDLKGQVLAQYSAALESKVQAIGAAECSHQEKAKQVNALVNQLHEQYRFAIVTSGASVKEIQAQLIVLQYCTTVASLEYRHRVWAYEYMALSRRVGELWERFCSAAWDSPSAQGVARIQPPKFAEVEGSIRDQLADHSIPDETRAVVNSAFDVLFELVGEISMKEDEVFTLGGVPCVIDFKSGFGSNEKGNTSRLLTVGRTYRLWNPDTKLYFLVRQEQNNHYLDRIKGSGLWDVRCGAEAYRTIDEITGSNMTEIVRSVVDFERDLSGDFWKDLGAHLSDLRGYLRW